MDSIRSLLSLARQRKVQKDLEQKTPAFDFENVYQDEPSSSRWDFADVFSYSESFFFSRWKKSFGNVSWRYAGAVFDRCVDGLFFVDQQQQVEHAEALLYMLMTEEHPVHVGIAIEPLSQLLTERVDEHLLSVVLNVLLFIVISHGEAIRAQLDEAEVIEKLFVMLDVLVEGNGPHIPVKKVTLLLWRSVACVMGSNNTIEKRKQELYRIKKHQRQKSRQADVDDMKKRCDRHFQCPEALAEALRVLESHLHVPAACLREPSSNQGRLIRKVIRDEMCVSREFSFKGRVHHRRRLKNVLPFELFYRRNLPHLQRYMMTFVKILVPLLIENSESTLDVLRETRYGLCKGDRDYQTHVDQQRHRAILLRSIVSTIFLLLRLARENALMQYEFFLGMLADANLHVLLFQFLQQDISTLCLQTFWVADSNVHFDFEEPSELPFVNWNNFVSAVNALKLIQKLVKHSICRVRELIDSRMDRMLKKLLRCNPSIKRCALKILKHTFRLAKMKQRQQEGALITAIYQELYPALNDDWLCTYYLERDPAMVAAEDLVHEAELREEVRRWNVFHYQSDPFAEEDDENVEDFSVSVNRMLCKLLTEVHVDLPTDKDAIIKWVDKEVLQVDGCRSEESFEKLFVMN